jgi:hypothetical protein
MSVHHNKAQSQPIKALRPKVDKKANISAKA